MNWYRTFNNIFEESFVLFLLLVLFVTDNVESYTPPPNVQQNQNEKNNIKNMVLEGECVVVCDEDTFPKLRTTDSIWDVGRRSNVNKVAFTAIRNESPVEMNGKVIKFDYIQLNYGNAYSWQTNSFTAPTNGVYMFEFVVFKRLNNSALKVALTVNGNPILVGYADGNNPNVETAQNSGLIGLNVGDVVQIELVYGSLDGGWQKSTFNGYLVYENAY